jgi:hypothetical protein
MTTDSVCVLYHRKYLIDVGEIGALIYTTIYLVK